MKWLRVLIAPNRRTEFEKTIHPNRQFWMRVSFLLLVILSLSALLTTPAFAQSGVQPNPTPAGSGATPQTPNQISVQPTAHDQQIRQRLESILQATGWFINPQVNVRQGVVFLSGKTTSKDYKTWAGNLANNTQDVAAVVNQIQVIPPSIWDFQPALTGLRDIWTSLIGSVPLLIFSLVVLLITYLLTRLSILLAGKYFQHRLPSPLLNRVAAYTAGAIVFVFGLYIVFHVAGLTNIALTVLGGTGLFGLVLGIAFRNITENFLASIFLSIQAPYRKGDLVQIADITGYVQALTTRATVIMTLDGNQVQIPNSTVYNSNIYNYTSTPSRREDFCFQLGYDISIPKAQDIALAVLDQHPAVLKDPEPWVLVDDLSSAYVNLRIYFWLNGNEHSWLKVKSSVIRLVTRAFQEAGIAMPDQPQEMLFPQGVPVEIQEPGKAKQAQKAQPEAAKPAPAKETASVSTAAEGGLSSEAGTIQKQASQARKTNEGENLLNPPTSG